MQNDEGVKARTKIVHNDADTLRPEKLEAPDRGRLNDVKGAKKQEACELHLPGKRGGYESEHLAGNFINYDVRGIVAMTGAGGKGRSGDSDGGGQCAISQSRWNEQVRREVAGD